METDLAAFDRLEAAVRAARAARETTMENWDAALAARKRGAHAAIDDGAPGLYRALFGHPSRAKKKPGTAAAPAAAPEDQATPSVAPTTQAADRSAVTGVATYPGAIGSAARTRRRQ